MVPPPKTWEEEESSEEESSEEESDTGKPAVPAPRKKFGDEEDSDEVADNWEEEDDSEAEAEKKNKEAATAAAKAKADAEAAKNKKPKSQRIEEHREAARRRRAADEEEEDSSEDDDEADRRARLRQAEKDADLKNAEDLLANAGLGPKNRTAPNKALIIEDKSQPNGAIDLSSLALFKPATKTQFDNLSAALVPLITASANKAHYSLWVQQFVKSICNDLPSTEIKKAASGLTALSNEKLKEEKAADKSGKKTKAAKTKTVLAGAREVGRGVADVTSYDDGLAEDDFM